MTFPLTQIIQSGIQGTQGTQGPAGSGTGGGGAQGAQGIQGATGSTTTYIFDGGSPSSTYNLGPAFDCGGVT